jgi:hypothetical protein
MIANLVAHLIPNYGFIKRSHSSKYGFPKFVALLIDLVLGVIVGAIIRKIAE